MSRMLRKAVKYLPQIIRKFRGGGGRDRRESSPSPRRH